ncbi:thymosin beta-4, Y-chromosomal, partial [Daubentonia madagascariensis]
EQEKQADES